MSKGGGKDLGRGVGGSYRREKNINKIILYGNSVLIKEICLKETEL